MSIIESVRSFICTCPFLKDGKIRVDYLGDTPNEYTIDGVPTTKIVKKYVDGGAIKQFSFYFASREYWGSSTLQNIENNGFYEQFSDWLDEKTSKNELPILSGNKSTQKIEALSPGYLLDASADAARYQIQCKLTYYED